MDTVKAMMDGELKVEDLPAFRVVLWPGSAFQLKA